MGISIIELVFCVIVMVELVNIDFNCCVVLCVNFGGDIDIIGVMVIVICGVLYGVSVINF